MRELGRYNDVLRRVAAEGDAALADAAREVPWTDTDFADPMHFAPSGSTKLATYLAGKIVALQAAPGGARGEARRASP